MTPRTLILCLALSPLAACAPPPSFPPIDSPATLGTGTAPGPAAVVEPTPAEAAAVATCAGTDIYAYIGQKASALPASGPWTSLRVLKPGDAATMDYSPTRLTVTVDNRNLVQTIACG